MVGILQVGLLFGAGLFFADEWAHRDELAARRFRELAVGTVASDIDQSRNRRWHRAGFRQRLELVALASVVVLGLTRSWLAGGLAFALMGSVVSLVFDISFNIRFGQRWWYAGTTAWTDEWLGKLRIQNVNAGKLAAAVELALVVASSVAWLMLM